MLPVNLYWFNQWIQLYHVIREITTKFDVLASMVIFNYLQTPTTLFTKIFPKIAKIYILTHTNSPAIQIYKFLTNITVK